MILASACTASTGTADDAAAQTSCEQSAAEVVDRFDSFLAPYADQSPAEFLANPELDGLEQFQNDVANIIVRVATDPNDDCTEADLEAEVDLALQDYAGDGLLNQYLVGIVRDGLAVERRDVLVTPDDDLTQVLPLLGPGSTVTLGEGTFTLDATILVQSDLTLIGAGQKDTVIESSASAAALAVLGAGSLTLNDLTLARVGDEPGSVLLAVDANLQAVDVTVSGGRVDAEDAGGSGIVLSAENPGPVVSLDRVTVSQNEAAGIAITGVMAPTIVNSSIAENGECGICYFDDSGGQLQFTAVQGANVGVQISGSAAPEIAHNDFTENAVAGLLIEGSSSPVVVDNRIAGVGDTVGIDVQGAAAPIVQANRLEGLAVGLSLRGESVASVSDNGFRESDVGLLVAGTANPEVFSNSMEEIATSAMLHSASSTGRFSNITITAADGAAVVLEGEAAPTIIDLVVDRGPVGVVFREQAKGALQNATITDAGVAIEIGDQAEPTVDGTTIVRAKDAAVIIGGSGSPRVSNSMIEDSVAIAIQAGGTGTPIVEANVIGGGDTAILVTDESQAMIVGNMLTGQSFGIALSNTAQPTISDNEIVASVAGAISFEGQSGGVVSDNRIIDVGIVGIRVGGQADPTLESNVLFAAAPEPVGNSGDSADDDVEEGTDDGTGDDAGDDAADETQDSGAGLLFVDQATGAATDNQLFGFTIGVQVSDQAAPSLASNVVDGAGIGGVGVLYGLDGAGTATSNIVQGQQLGFQLSGNAAPILQDNVVTAPEAAAFLVQGDARPVLDSNECDQSPVGIVILEQAEVQATDNLCEISEG
jgi:parallel beta-helix repeat protein